MNEIDDIIIRMLQQLIEHHKYPETIYHVVINKKELRKYTKIIKKDIKKAFKRS